MVSKKVFHQIHRCLIKIVNLPSLPFAGRSTLVVGDFHQLSRACAMPVNTSSLD